MEDRPPPNIGFFRTKRFWFCWAVPGLLLALWVEGMLFSQSIWIDYFTPSSLAYCYSSVTNGTVFMKLTQTTYYPTAGGTISGKWIDPGSSFSLKSGLELFPATFHHEETMDGITSQRYWQINIPLWLPFILWLFTAHLWSRHQKRKQAALREGSIPFQE